MSDARPVFVNLEDVATAVGVPLHKAVEGDAAAGKNAHGAFVAKNDAGNLVYLRANANRELVVTSDSNDYARLTSEGGVVGSATFQTLATIALTDGATYRNIGFLASCFRDAVVEVLWVDDVGGANTEVVLATFRVGSGHFTHSEELESLEFVAGTTAELRIRAKLNNASPASDIDGMVSALEVQ